MFNRYQIHRVFYKYCEIQNFANLTKYSMYFCGLKGYQHVRKLFYKLNNRNCRHFIMLKRARI